MRLASDPIQFFQLMHDSLIGFSMDCVKAFIEPEQITIYGDFNGVWFHNEYKPDHFAEYECLESETLILNKELYANLRDLGFGRVRELRVETKPEIKFSSYHKSYKPDFLNVPCEYLEVPVVKVDRVGLLPKKRLDEITYQGRYSTVMLFLPEHDSRTRLFSYKGSGKRTQVRIQQGDFDRDIYPLEVLIDREKFDIELLTFRVKRALDCLSGIVVLSVYASANTIILSQNSPTFTKTYMIR